MASATQASLLLQKQLKDLCKRPVDGFSAGLVDETNVFEWSVSIIGPPDTLYDGGFFNAIMSFPPNYPNSPPSVRFTSEIWHPNVYPDGRVCISILHPPGDDPNGYELASERWSPVHTVESIVLSIISMLSSPNDESPANIEAAVMIKFWTTDCLVGLAIKSNQNWFLKLLVVPLFSPHLKNSGFSIILFIFGMLLLSLFYILHNVATRH
ncbi:ubiquitin-conjugating enzyme E2 7-like isoform X2 [Malania oleifera]|uniref:ubiquitin-conjugating enzyme E2 7-like isoform X2 n=1 Tax=Malania oleifera TaxID=397392 RepID=UPI0025AE585C|nr:ubiquitin-conjugating enzyme E2 7-like isoform X2 [Malania oleifera]